MSLNSVSFDVEFEAYVNIFGIGAYCNASLTQSSVSLELEFILFNTLIFDMKFMAWRPYTNSAGVAIPSAGFSVHLELSGISQFFAMILDEITAVFAKANAAAQKGLKTAQEKVTEEHDKCMAKVAAAAAREAAHCMDCVHVCFEATSWACKLCVSCYWSHGLHCGSCTDRCEANLMDDCNRGCSKICNAIVDITLKLGDAGCDTLNVASKALSGASDAMNSINAALATISSRAINGFTLQTLVFDRSMSKDFSKGSKLPDLQATADVVIVYTLHAQQHTVNLHVSLSSVKDMVRQYADHLFQKMTGQLAPKRG